MKKITSLFVLNFFLISVGFSQQTTDLKEVFLAAESYFLFEEFEEALPLYLRLHRTSPDNYNLFFKIGVCYLNDAYEKDKSIYYLEKASENINPKYKESNIKELGAPLDALFFLGNAYRINNKLDKAREAYKKFQSQMDTEIYNDELVLEQLSACDVAEKLMKKPVDMDIEILPNQLNTRFADKNPAVSGDETKMVFVSKLQFYDAVFYSEKKNGEWSYPRNITPELGVDGDVYPTCLSYDGNILFVYRNDEFIGNLYTSTLKDGVWTPLVKLNENINTKYWESHASLTKDGNTLYFTSNRKEGYGGLDIYKSSKLPGGEWGIPVNLGPSVNSSYNEETPFITEDGNRLFFSSYGHYNMGGYDIFMSILQSDSIWAKPVNIGFPVNTTDDDLFFCAVGNGELAYFPVYKETGYGKHDIYRYQVYTADHPRKYEISGLLNYSGVRVINEEIKISVISLNTNDTLAITSPDESGKFSFHIPEGKYSMVFESTMFEKEIKSLDVNKNTPHSGITISERIKLIPLPVRLSEEEVSKLIEIEESEKVIYNNKPVEIDFEAEKGSTVIIKHYADSVLVKIDTIQIDKRKQTYEYVPLPGKNHIEFTLTDKDGNRVTKIVTTEYLVNEDADLTIATQEEEGEMIKNIQNGLPQDNIKALLNDLNSRSEGPLKEALKNLDLSKEGIENTVDLFSYLYENAEYLGYTKEDVDNLYIEMISKKDLEEFLVNLKNASQGNLKTAISELDLNANNIHTPDQAVDFLIRNAQRFNYTPEDLIIALAFVGSNGVEDHKMFINKLIQSSGEGALKVYLKTLDLATMDPVSPKDFAIALYRNSAVQPYTEADVLIALTNLGVNRGADEVMNSFMLVVQEGVLKDYLKNLDLEKEGIYTSEQLIAHLYANADIKGYSREDVDHLMQEYLYNQVQEIDDLRLKMAALATGNLKDYLLKTDLNQHAFGSREEFIDFLISESASNGFSQADVNSVLLKLSYNGDLEDIAKQFGNHSEGKLKETLEHLDLKKEGITSFDELIQYLLDHNEEFGYSKEDVYNMIADYTSATDLKLFYDKLIRIADPETRSFLQTIDLKANGINDRSELTSFILEKYLESNVDQEKIIRLLLSATEANPEDLLLFLQSNSTGELNKLLNSGKFSHKDFTSASDIYDKLIEASLKNKGISAEDINALFQDYLNNDSLKQFVDQLSMHSSENLTSFLQNLDLTKAGIKTVTDLILYLISNAEANDYSINDVFSALEKTLGKSRLEDFVTNLREFAPSGLLSLLNKLDFKKEGINTIEDLLKYLTEHAEENNYSMDDLWDSILQLVISGDKKAQKEQTEAFKNPQEGIKNEIIYTLGILGLSGIALFLIILIKRKRTNKL